MTLSDDHGIRFAPAQLGAVETDLPVGEEFRGKREWQRVQKWKAQASPEEISAYNAWVRKRRREWATSESGKVSVKRSKRAAYEKNMAFIESHRIECANCGESDKICLQFHHLDPSKKEKNVVATASLSRSRILSEIAKCVVLCANCHLKAHAAMEREAT